MITYEDVGITPVINACGKMTLLGASVLDSRVAEAMAAASRHNINMMALEDKAGERIASWTGAEAACVTGGAAAGIAIGAAAFIAGADIARAQMLPECTWEKREIIIQSGHLVNFAGMARQGGARLVPIGWVNYIARDHLASAITPDTAGFLYIVSHHTVQKGMLPLADCIQICHQKDIPVLVDAAAEEDLQKYVAMGADLVAYSGGKAFGGPSFGFLCGKKDLIQACRVQEYGIARAMKVTKEGIMGLLAALELYTQAGTAERRQHEAEINQIILDGLKDLPDVRVSLESDEVRYDLLRVQLQLGGQDPAASARELIQFLRSGDPPIVTRDHKADMGIIAIDPRGLEKGHADVIVRQLQEFFSEVRQSI